MNDIDLTGLRKELDEIASNFHKNIPREIEELGNNSMSTKKIPNDPVLQYLLQYNVEVDLEPFYKVLKDKKSQNGIRYSAYHKREYAEKKFLTDYELVVSLVKDGNKLEVFMYAGTPNRIFGNDRDLSEKITGFVLKDNNRLTTERGKEFRLPFNIPINGVRIRYEQLSSDRLTVRLYH